MKKLFRAEVITLSFQFDIQINRTVGCYTKRFFDLSYSTVIYIYESRKRTELFSSLVTSKCSLSRSNMKV